MLRFSSYSHSYFRIALSIRLILRDPIRFCFGLLPEHVSVKNWKTSSFFFFLLSSHPLRELLRQNETKQWRKIWIWNQLTTFNWKLMWNIGTFKDWASGPLFSFQFFSSFHSIKMKNREHWINKSVDREIDFEIKWREKSKKILIRLSMNWVLMILNNQIETKSPAEFEIGQIIKLTLLADNDIKQ